MYDFFCVALSIDYLYLKLQVTDQISVLVFYASPKLKIKSKLPVPGHLIYSEGSSVMPLAILNLMVK